MPSRIRITSLFTLSFILFYSTLAEPSCRWVVHGQLVGFANASINNQEQSWPIANAEVRIQARWSTGGWWNSDNWPEVNSSADGSFIVTSENFSKPNCKRARDIRLRLRTGPWGEWETHLERSFSGSPTGESDYHIYLHNSNCVGICSEQPIRLNDVFRPLSSHEESDPIDSSGNDSGSDENEGAANGGSDQESVTDISNMTIEQDECVARRSSNLIKSVDLTFSPLPESNLLTTEDGLLQLERRSNAEGETHNRLSLRVNVINNSENSFEESRKCTALVAFGHNEGPGTRPVTSEDYPWYFWTRELSSLNPNESVIVSKTTNLYGVGDVLVGNWQQAGRGYDYVRLRVHIDFQNNIREHNKDNNVIEYCYSIPEHQFVEMSHCERN